MSTQMIGEESRREESWSRERVVWGSCKGGVGKEEKKRLEHLAQRRDCIGVEFGRCTIKTRRAYWIPILQIFMEHVCTAYSSKFNRTEGVTLFYSVSFYFVFLLYHADPQVEVQIRILLKDKYVKSCQKCEHQQSHFDFLNNAYWVSLF